MELKIGMLVDGGSVSYAIDQVNELADTNPIIETSPADDWCQP